MKRSELKAIIKECLVEILAEGIGQESINEAVSLRRSPSIDLPPRRNASKNRKAVDLISYGQGKNTEPVRDITPQVEQVTSSLTSDPVLADILRDTAMTTMQEQVNADRRPNAGSAPPQMGVGASGGAGVDIDSMMSGGNNWAQLAFMD